jgi:hypothetical protein
VWGAREASRYQGGEKALLQALVAEIREESRKLVRPFFRVPLDASTAEAPTSRKKFAHRQDRAPGRNRTSDTRSRNGVR